MDTKPVVSVSLNPALDLTVALDQIELGEVNLALQGSLHAAGKGLNVARVLKDLGHDVIVTGFVGEDNASPFNQTCETESLQNKFFAIPGATRINVKLSEKSQRVTDVNLPGLTIPEADWDKFQQRLESLAANASAVVLAGSLPPGLHSDAYRVLINELKALGCPVILDSSGEAFKEAIQAGPSLIKPNLEELEQWLGTKIDTLEQLKNAAAKAFALGVEHVVVSNGSKGCYWFQAEQALVATPPKIRVVSTVGAGDSLVAGLTHALINQLPATDGLIKACAVSAHAVEQVGVGIKDPGHIQALQQQVNVKPFESLEAL